MDGDDPAAGAPLRLCGSSPRRIGSGPGRRGRAPAGGNCHLRGGPDIDVSGTAARSVTCCRRPSPSSTDTPSALRLYRYAHGQKSTYPADLRTHRGRCLTRSSSLPESLGETGLALPSPSQTRYPDGHTYTLPVPTPAPYDRPRRAPPLERCAARFRQGWCWTLSSESRRSIWGPSVAPSPSMMEIPKEPPPEQALAIVPPTGQTDDPPDPFPTRPSDGSDVVLGSGTGECTSRGRATADHTSLPPELWLEIFRYATHVPRARTIVPADPFVPERPANYATGMNAPIQSLRTKCVLVRVCRVWRALATELLYEHAVLGSARRVQLFCRTLVESQAAERKVTAAADSGAATALGHGRWVRHLQLEVHNVHGWARSSRSTHYWQCVMHTVYLCPRLRVFSGVWQPILPQGVVAALGQYLPSTLQELYWQQDSVMIAAKELPVLTTSFLSKFSALRVLDLRKICILDAERSIQDVSFVALTLPHVAYLALPTCPLLLRFASMQDMPALHYLILDAGGAPRTVWAPWVSKELTGFLEKHGQKLTTVELLPTVTQSFRPGPIGISAFLSPTVCPNLDTLVFDCREKAICPSTDALSWLSDRDARDSAARVVAQASAGTTGPATPLLEAAHPRLRRVGLRGAGISRLYPNKPSQAQAHLHALAGCRAAFLPGLELVRTPGFLVSTSTDPYAPDVFVWWTEKLERVGVDLQDGEGVVWLLEEEEAKPGAPQKDEKEGRKSAEVAPVGQEDLGGRA